MNGAYYVGAIGLQAQQRALDMIAGNIANINTPAFKRTEVRFSQVLASQSDPDVPAAQLAYVPVNAAAVTVDGAVMTDETGPLQATGHAMDVAIDGRGFIELMGPEGQTMLWRGGTLHVGEDGLLTAPNGMALKAAITVPDDAGALTIGTDGIVRTAATDGTISATELGHISLVRVDDAASLQSLDGGIYRLSDDARTTDAQPGEDGTGMMVQGSIERSNVQMSDEMVQMMLVQRAYGANAQLIQAADQMMSIANGLRR